MKTALKFQQKGDPVYVSRVELPGKGVWHRLFFGSYATSKLARKAAGKLKQRNFRQAIVVKKPYALQVEQSDDPQGLLRALKGAGYLPVPTAPQAAGGGAPVIIGAFDTRKDAQRALTALKDAISNAKIVRR